MSSSPSSRKPSWKDAAGAGSKKTPRQDWQSTKPNAPVKPGRPWWSSRRAKLAYVLSGLGAIAAAIVFVILWFNPPKPIRLVLIGANTEDNLAVPHNVPARLALDAMEQWATGQNTQIEPKRVDLSDDNHAIDELFHSDLMGRRSSAFVVYVGACGIVCKEAGVPVPCLVRPSHLKGDQPPYRFDLLLTALEKLPAKTRKLLFLDATPTDAYWPMGQFHQAFVRAVKASLAQKNIENLIVISSAGPEEKSWSSTRDGMTIFAHFVREALNGAADPNGTRINAGNLYRYVRKEVEHWVMHNRGTVQRPSLLFGTEEQLANWELGRHDPYKPAAEPPAPKLPLEDLRAVWEQCRKLRDAVPSPAVYTPHLWREYLDRLLRAEQVIRAGGNPGEWKRTLDKLAERITEARSLPRESLARTLGMPEVFGLSAADAAEIAKRDELINRIKRLWRDWSESIKTYADQKSSYDAIAADLTKMFPDRFQYLRTRLQLSKHVLTEIAKDPGKNLVYGRQVLSHLDDRLAPERPVEAHRVVMLMPDPLHEELSPIKPLRTAERWPTLQLFLQVGMLAEQAALGLGDNTDKAMPAYSEQIMPWIRRTMDEADGRRRIAEDLIFTSLEDSWNEADSVLKKEEGIYKNEVQKAAMKIRSVLHQRDRIMAELPYYTRWLSRDPSEEEGLIKLWNKIHLLDKNLEKQTEEGFLLARAQKLEDQLHGEEGITKSFENLEKKAQDLAAREFAASKNVRDWRNIEEVLQVPFLPVDDRMKLLKASQDIGARLEEGTATDQVALTESDAALEGKAREAARRQGRLALAELGSDGPQYEEAIQAVKIPKSGAWYESLQEAGEMYGKALVTLGKRAEELTTQAATEELAKARPHLVEAARLARQLDGFEIGVQLKADPAGDLRKLQLHDLLCWQAARARLDFWASEKTSGDSPTYYFREAGLKYLDDARAFVAGPSATPKDPRLSLEEQERGFLKAVSPPVLESSASFDKFEAGTISLDVTDEKEMRRNYRFRSTSPTPPGQPAGQPVCWVEPGEGMRLKSGDPFDKQHRPVNANSSFQLSLIPDDLSSLLKRDHRVVSFFRGHRSVVDSKLSVQRLPDLATTTMPPKRAGRVAVQINSELYDQYAAAKSAISIVLDCSGSMKEGGTARSSWRWTKATRALKEVLLQLPAGVKVSLHIFSADGLDYEEDPELKGFAQIKQVWKHISWNSDPRVINRKMAEIESLTPKWQTPLVRSIIRAVQEKEFREFDGSKTLVVITDGGDSNFYLEDMEEDNRKFWGKDYAVDEDLHEKYGPTIRAALRKAFGGSQIQLHVIGFEVSAKEQKLRGYRDFRKAIDQLKGTYSDVKNREKLAFSLRRALLNMFFWVDSDTGDPVPGLPPDGASVSQTERLENLRWLSLPTGNYLVRIPAVKSLLQQVHVGAGDSLLLELAEASEGKALGFRRSSYAQTYLKKNQGFAMLAPKTPSGWQLAALENRQLAEDPNLQIMTTLDYDQKVAGPNQRVSVPSPLWSWFEVAPKRNEKKLSRLRVFSLPNYPAPAWSLDLDEWPVNPSTEPLVRGWWLQENQDFPVAGRKSKPDFESILKLPANSSFMETKENNVTLESVQREDCKLEVSKGEWRDFSNCLVIRLKYPPGKGPYFAHLPGLDKDKKSVQHRFYTRVGKTTSIFWPISSEEADQFSELQVISVAECKNKARPNNESLELDKPDDRNDRPNHP